MNMYEIAIKVIEMMDFKTISISVINDKSKLDQLIKETEMNNGGNFMKIVEFVQNGSEPNPELKKSMQESIKKIWELP